MVNIQEELKKIGLTKDESMTYLAGLELGPATILEIARRAGLNRTTLYSVVGRLIEKQLFIKSIMGRRVLYIAEPPEKIISILKDRLAQFGDLLPELLLLSRGGVYKPKIKYYEGFEGIRSIYLNSLNSKERTLFAFVGVEHLIKKSKKLHDFWDGEYRASRLEKNIFGKIIVPDNVEGRIFKDKDNKSNRETRMIPANNYNFEGEVLMFDDVVCFISYSENEEFALSLESKAIAKTLKMIWRVVWNTGY